MPVALTEPLKSIFEKLDKDMKDIRTQIGQTNAFISECSKKIATVQEQIAKEKREARR